MRQRPSNREDPKRMPPRRDYRQVSYQEVIDQPTIADASLVMAWARTSGRLNPGEKHMWRLTSVVLGDFAKAHGLPRDYYTLAKDGVKPRVVPESDRYPDGANPQSAAAQTIDLPSRWPQSDLPTEPRVYQPVAYQAVIDNPAISDPSLVMAWAHATNRLTPTARALSLVPSLLADFSDAHGLPRDYYSVVQAGELFLEPRFDRYADGADPTSAAAQRISLPTRWKRAYLPAAYQEVVDNPSLADVPLIRAWARATGRIRALAYSNTNVSPKVIRDFAEAHGLTGGSYTLVRDGKKSHLNSDPARLAVNPDQVAPLRISLPERWKEKPADAITQYGQPVDGPGYQPEGRAGSTPAYADPSGQYAGYAAPQAELPQNSYASMVSSFGAAPGAVDTTMLSSSTGNQYPSSSRYQSRQAEYPPEQGYHSSVQYVSGPAASTSYGYGQSSTTPYPEYSAHSGHGFDDAGPSRSDYNTYPQQSFAPAIQYAISSDNLADISYTTQSMNSLNITTNNWQSSSVAGIPSAAIPTPEADFDPKPVRQPTPKGHSGRRHRR
ncbi:hypothetical protein ACLQ25_32385 [Micromonospora sp. DT44]|uniref:hypothetical protein n=1 Tax=Micromonospora sp. DT44 TaxID=3393439 RepID=UPI003CE8424D